MDETMSVDILIRYAVMMLGLMVLFFFLAVLTPWLAKKVDAWIAKYRENHSVKRDPTYSIRSIYELPPKKEADSPEIPPAQEDAGSSED